MRPVQVSVVGSSGGPATNGISQIIPLDRMQVRISVGVGTYVSGTATWSVQHTYDDITNSSVTPTWFTLSSLSSVTSNTDSKYDWPVQAIRLVVTGGTGTVTLIAIQGAQG